MANCKEEGCQVATTGKCVNNLDIDSCPYYTEDEFIDEDLNEEYEDDEEIKNSNSNVVDVYSGKALSLNEVNRISTTSLTRLVILAGLPDAGKTTLLLSLMHLFQTEPTFEGFLFAGSETLLDFEEKSHKSKIASVRDNPDTDRTPLGPPTFLHLKVAEKDDIEKMTDLLFTDISGELFRTLKDSTSEAKSFSLCQRADHFAIFFDTERITSLKERANAKASGLGVLRSLSEAGTLQPHTRIQIIFSRWDLFSTTGDKEGHDEFIEVLKQQIISQYGKTYQIDFFEVSARPKNNLMPFGYGIKDVFPLWVKKSLLDRNKLGAPKPALRAGQRQFLQYQFNK